MASVYKQFLASPSTSLLSDNATLHYVTTVTSFNGAAEIIKHLNNIQKHLKKKKEEILNIVESHNAVAVELDTGIEFLISGGPYLPGLDDNFVSDRLVYFPVVRTLSYVWPRAPLVPPRARHPYLPGVVAPQLVLEKVATLTESAYDRHTSYL